MQWFEDEVRQLERKVAARKGVDVLGIGPVVFYGSSSIRLWGSLERDFAGVPVVNLGFGGSTLAACSWFFWRVVRPVAPQAMVVYAGDNDLADGASPEEVLGQFRHLWRQAEVMDGGMPKVFLSIKISPCRWHLREKIEWANELIRGEFSQRPGDFVDVTSVLLDEAGVPEGACFLEDGLHLSAEGYQRWTKVLTEKVSFLHSALKPVL